MTLAEAWDWLQSFTNLEKAPNATKRTWRLDRMEALLADRGHPEAAALSVHLAGSKGKGSTAAYLSSLFTAAGFPAGLYTSPHVADWRERITRNGRNFPEEAYIEAASGLRAYWEGMEGTKKARFLEDWGGPPTTFEWLTLTAHEVFRSQKVAARVLETGLGGRLDATNAQVPTAAVLTLIELEHTDILGDTLELIAGEKAGILKPGVPAFTAAQKPEVLEVFRRRAAEVGAPLREFTAEVPEPSIVLDRQGTDLTVDLSQAAGRPLVLRARLPMLGQAQGLNAAFAAWIFVCLAGQGLVPLGSGANLEAILVEGLGSTRLPGRMQVLSQDPWVVVDGAHTAESAALLARSWEALAGRGHTLVFGAFEGKAVEPMARVLAPLFDRVIVTPPGFFRPSDPPGLKRAFEAARPGLAVEVADRPAEAMKKALQSGGPVLVCGSFYLAGEVSSPG